MDPPSPVTCPIAGRYMFTQKANGQWEPYQTRIRGVTDRPRVQVTFYNDSNGLHAPDSVFQL